MIYNFLFALGLLVLWGESAYVLFADVPPVLAKLLMLANLLAWGLVYLDQEIDP